MSTMIRIAWMGALAVGCGTPSPDAPDPEPTASTPTVSEPGVCDPQPALQRHQCLTCHGADAQGGLDLRPEGLASRLVGVPAAAQGCEGRLLVDPMSPENSQLLRVLRPDTQGRCVLAMPPPPAVVPDDDVACIEEWVASFAETESGSDFEPTPLDAAVTRAKRLTTGATPTADEIARVHADPSALRDLVRGWTTTQDFRAVTERTLAQLLQVEPGPTDWVQIDGRGSAGIPATFDDMLAESVVRTAWALVEEDRPLTEIFRTERWAVTTAMLVMMRYADQASDEQRRLDRTHLVVPAADDTPVTDWSPMVESGIWSIPGLPENCRGAQGPELRTRQLLHLQWGVVDCRLRPDFRFRNQAPLVPGVDDTDWRFVEFTRIARDAELEEPPFYDVEAWRSHAPTVQTRVARTGFMTTPAFLNNWETNPDNEFRVTTNQMLIVALGSTFSLGEPTAPASLDGLNEAHSDPSSECYGCHRQLDPMRGYFSQHFSDTWRPSPTVFDYADPDELLPFTPSFAFGGVTAQAGDIDRLGDVLADHPGVATAWTQKLCWLANGSPCRIDDPEFQRVASTFESSGFSYRELVVELFSSPLVTGLAPTLTHADGLPVGLQRAEHWCNAVAERGADSCRRRAVGEPLGLLPGVSFARAKVDPIVPQRMTAFAVAGLEKACQTLASREVGGPGSPFLFRDPDTAIPAMVEQLAGLAPGHERYAALGAALSAHRDEVFEQTSDLRLAMESTYVVACASPDAAALGL